MRLEFPRVALKDVSQYFDGIVTRHAVILNPAEDV
jgi:hypothetical protein